MTAAADVYELVAYDTYETLTPPTWRAALMRRLRRTAPDDDGGVIISVRHRETDTELFRHIEDGGDDEDHLLQMINQDLASMTADDFAARWG